jgi:ABC-type transporter Mla subunit MlaD
MATTENSTEVRSMNKHLTSLQSIAQELNDMAAQISSFQPVLNHINDADGELPGSVRDQLEMIANLSDYINSRLGEAAEKLSRLDKQAA